jgi:hypothetical protein
MFSDGGKLELWDINTRDTVCSETAHSDSITGLCVRSYLCSQKRKWGAYILAYCIAVLHMPEISSGMGGAR